jgi:hypothetical protein
VKREFDGKYARSWTAGYAAGGAEATEKALRTLLTEPELETARANVYADLRRRWPDLAATFLETLTPEQRQALQ